jgi:hypothetical protein
MIIIGIVGISISCLLLASPTPAQMVCGANPQPEPITLTVDNGEVVVKLQTSSQATVQGSSLTVSGDGIAININYNSEVSDFTIVNVSNSKNAYDWGPGIIALNSYSGVGIAAPIPVDLSPLPPDYARLWTRMMKIVGELIETDEFWKLIGVEKNDPATLAVFQKIRDGYSAPSAYNQIMSLKSGVSPRYEVEGQLCRTYNLNGICDMNIATPDAMDELNPMLYVMLGGKYGDSRWILTTAPIAHKCTFKWDMGDSTKPIEEAVWRGKLATMRDNLVFFRDRIPSLAEKGVIGSDSELGSLIDKSMEAIDTYAIELVYPPSRASQTSGGTCPVRPSITISLPEGDLKVAYDVRGASQVSGSTITFTSDRMNAQFSFHDEEKYGMSIRVVNGNDPFKFGKNYIQLSSYQSGSEEPTAIVDLKSLPYNYRDLWDGMRATIGQVIEKDEFWQLMGAEKDKASLKSQLEALRDGYIAPTAYQDIFNIVYNIREKWTDYPTLGVSRGYTLVGIDQIEISTSSSYDNPKPIIQVSLSEQGHLNNWTLDINPDTKICTLSIMGRDMAKEVTEDQWKSVVKRMIENLQFFQDQMPVLIDSGIIKPGDELANFLTLALEGMANYPVEFVPYVPAVAPKLPN